MFLLRTGAPMVIASFSFPRKKQAFQELHLYYYFYVRHVSCILRPKNSPYHQSPGNLKGRTKQNTSMPSRLVEIGRKKTIQYDLFLADPLLGGHLPFMDRL